MKVSRLFAFFSLSSLFLCPSVVRAADLGYDFDGSAALSGTPFYGNGFNRDVYNNPISTEYFSSLGAGSYTLLMNNQFEGYLKVDAATSLVLTLSNDSSYVYNLFDISDAFSSATGATKVLDYAVVNNSAFTSSSFSYASVAWTPYLSGLVLDPNSTLLLNWSAKDGGTYNIDNIIVTATQVPEPSTYALFLGVGTLGLVGWRRFRRK